MSDRILFDTNILLYAYDIEACEKRQMAANLIRSLSSRHGGGQYAGSSGVLSAKIPSPLSPSEARVIVGQYCVWHVELNTPASVIHASEIQERYRLSFWDALIVAAASRAGSAILYSEDFSHDQIMEGVKVLNPFRDPDVTQSSISPSSFLRS